MTKYRPPIPHTPPSTSLRGVDLCNSIEALAAFKLHWRLRDESGIVHEIGASIETHGVPLPACNDFADGAFEDTLGDVTCLWCAAGLQR